MKKIYLPILLVLTLSMGTLSCNQGATPQPPAVGPTGTGTQLTPEIKAARDYRGTTVQGCDGGTGSATAAESALFASDFATCNREASCAFNTSVESGSGMVDSKAAFYGILCKLALSIESPQMEQLAMEPLKAADYFGQPNGVESLADKLEAKWFADGLVTLQAFLESQQAQGRDVEAVFQLVLDFIIENFYDIHIMARALANDANFTADIPSGFLGVAYGNPDLQGWSAVELGLVDFWAMNLLMLSELFQHYRIGIDSPASLTDETLLMTDMNTENKFLSRIPNSGETESLRNAVVAWSEATVQAAGNFSTRWNEGTNKFDVAQWIYDSDLFPLHDQAESLELALMSTQLRRSLDGELVWLATSNNSVAINLGGILENLPDANGVAGNPLQLDGTDIEINGDFMKALLGPNFAEK